MLKFFTILLVAIVNALPVDKTDWHSLKNLGPHGHDPIGVISSPPLQNCSLPCFPSQRGIMGWDVTYDPCMGGCRTQVCRAFYAGDPAYLASHPSTPLFNGWTNFHNSTAMPYSLFLAKKYPAVYPNIPKNPSTDTLSIMAWQHGAQSQLQDYPWPFVGAGWGALAVANDMVGGTFNITMLLGIVPVYQPLGDLFDQLQFWDAWQCIEWAKSLNYQPGPLLGKVKHDVLVTGHSKGGKWAYDAANGNARLGLPKVPNVKALSPLDPSLWNLEDYELEVTEVPQTVWNSAQYVGTQGEYRPLAKSSTIQTLTVVQYNSDHQEVNFLTEAEGNIALENDLSVSFSVPLSYPDTNANWWAVSDQLGHKVMGNPVMQASALDTFDIMAYMLGNSIQAYLYNNITALRLLQLDSMQEYLGSRGFARGYTSCGSTVWDPNNGQTTAVALEDSSDTYDVSYSVGSVNANILNQSPGTPCTVVDTSRCTWFRLTCSDCTIQMPGPQSTLQLLQCLAHHGQYAKILEIIEYLVLIDIPWS